MVTLVELEDEADALLYEVKAIPGRGFGIVARFDIPRGTRIMTEEPLLIIKLFEVSKSWVQLETEILAGLETLKPEQQKQFLTLHNNFTENSHCGLFQTNAIQLGDSTAGVFPTVCRINHSCVPNAHYTWRQDIHSEIVHAIRDIAAREEITISYCIDSPSQCRRETLKANYGFQCDCELCALHPHKLQESEARRETVMVLDKSIGAWLAETFTLPRQMEEAVAEKEWSEADTAERLNTAFDSRDGTANAPERILGDCHRLLRLKEEEYGSGYPPAMARAYHDAFLIAAAYGDQARASVFAKGLHEARLFMQGEDSPGTQRAKSLMESPESDPRFGLSWKWKASIDMIPDDCDNEALEKWLWKRGEENIESGHWRGGKLAQNMAAKGNST